VNCSIYGSIYITQGKGLKMDKFDYYMEFLKMQVEDPSFKNMYKVNEFDKWYADFMEILNQKHGEYHNEM
jgi:hypothetical protein